MENDPIELRTPTGPHRSLHVLDKPSHDEQRQGYHSAAWRRTWLEAVLVLLALSFIGFVVNHKRANSVQQPSPERERMKALADQLSTLKQTDLITFPDGRVWYVRAVRGRDLEVVGWIGDYTRSENIDSFVLKENEFAIVRHKDPRWPEQRNRFFDQ